MKLTLDELSQTPNIAPKLKKQQLEEISSQVTEGYAVDKDSTERWKQITEDAVKVMNNDRPKSIKRSFGEGSNVPYPLIKKAVIDFAARTYPEVIQNGRLVKSIIYGEDPEDTKYQKASRVTSFMNYQLLEKFSNWEDGTDSLLHMIALYGVMFRKTFYDPVKQQPTSKLCHPYDVILNYNTECLDDARRITHVIRVYKNDIIENIRAGIFSDVDIDKLNTSAPMEDDRFDDSDVLDSDPVIVLLEQHCYLDLDDDGYQEPYLVTIHEASGEVLRIRARYTLMDVRYNEDREVVCIKPECYFTDYHFIKSPDGGFYSIGLGNLLLPINEAISTILNQLIDSGKLNNMPSGLFGKSLRIRGGDFVFKAGEWKQAETVGGGTIRDNVFPLPTKEPSPTLYQLLGLLIEAGKDLASSNNALEGKQPAQNVAATTMLALIEQGMKVFNSIQKRLYRSFKSEYKKLFRLNRLFLSDEEYQRVLDIPATVAEDFDESQYDVCPVADPSMSSDAQRLTRAQALMQVNGLDDKEKLKQYLIALQFSDMEIKKLIPEQAPPSPEMIKAQMQQQELQQTAQYQMGQLQIQIQDLQLKAQQQQQFAEESAARIAKMISDMEVSRKKVELTTQKVQLDAMTDYTAMQQDLEKERMKAANKIRVEEVKNSGRSDN